MEKGFLDTRGRVWKLIKQVVAKMEAAAAAEDISTFNYTDAALKKVGSLMQLDDMKDDFVLKIYDLNGTSQENLDKIESILSKVL